MTRWYCRQCWVVQVFTFEHDDQESMAEAYLQHKQLRPNCLAEIRLVHTPDKRQANKEDSRISGLKNKTRKI